MTDYKIEYQDDEAKLLQEWKLNEMDIGFAVNSRAIC